MRIHDHACWLSSPRLRVSPPATANPTVEVGVTPVGAHRISLALEFLIAAPHRVVLAAITETAVPATVTSALEDP